MKDAPLLDVPIAAKERNTWWTWNVPLALVSSGAFAIIGQSLAIAGLESFNAAAYNDAAGAPDYDEGECNAPWTNNQLLGLFLFVFLFPPAVVSMAFFDNLLFKLKTPWIGKNFTILLRLAVFGLIVIYSIDGAVTTARWSQPLLKTGVIFMHNHPSTGGTYQSGFVQTTGLALFLLCLISIFYHLYLIYLTLSNARNEGLAAIGWPKELSVNDNIQKVVRASSTDNPELQRPYRIPNRQRHVWCSAVFLGLLFLPLFFFLCTFVINSFEAFSPQTALRYVSSPIKHGPENCPWDGNSTYYMCPEFPDPVFYSFDIQIKDDFYLHLFPDVLMFYGFLYAIVLISTATQFFPQLYTWMHRSHKISLSIGLVSNGTILLIVMFCVLLINWIIYWGHDHFWVEYGDRTGTERAARTLGQCANLVLGLLCFPLSRTSLFTHLFGTSWEALLILHRWLGYVFVLFVMTHMFTWWYVFSEQGYFPYDVFHLLIHYPPYHPDGPPCADNFTIPLISLTTFIIIIIFGVFTYHKIRRAKFEFFYWTHHFFLSVFIAVILHAASAWFFVLGGLLLWFVDRLFRLYNSSRVVDVLEMRTRMECTQLTLQVQESIWVNRCCSGRNDTSMNWNMGQYVFINIPCISPLEWHPFSIASSPTDLYPSLFIKDMGVGTFTNKVNALAAVVEDDRSFADLVVNVDGPYGLPLDWERFRRIIIIAGGIGITPCHSIFRGLYYLNKSGASKVKLTRVYLIWAAREQEMFEIDAFAETFSRVDKNNQDGIFHYSLFVTSRKPKEENGNSNGHSDGKKKANPKVKSGRFDIRDELKNMDASEEKKKFKNLNPDLQLNEDQVHSGRPNLHSELSFLTTNLDAPLKPVKQEQGLLEGNEVTSDSIHPSRVLPSSTADVLVFTCGPDGLVKSAQDFAYEIGASFHAETFCL